MSFYNIIEAKLAGISEGDFHRICDAFLGTEYNTDVHSTGKATGKSKTKAGKPDGYCLVREKYIIAEYTTKDSKDQSAFKKKLISDLESLLDPTQTNIPLDKVEIAILCCNSNVETNISMELMSMSADKGVRLRIVSLSKIAEYLSYKGRAIAKDVLGIPFDAGQLSSIADFVDSYSKRGTGTTLKNQFFGRSKEIDDLINLLSNNDIVIIKAKPGIGKTKLVTHTLDAFLVQNPTYNSFVIHQQQFEIYEHLTLLLEPSKDYLLFIDDANMQVENIMKTLAFRDREQNNSIKLILTVRDYAYSQIIKCFKDRNVKDYNLLQIPEETLIEILTSEDFAITDEGLIAKILRLSAGNARLAIIMASIVSQQPGFNLENRAEVYEQYFNQVFLDIDLLKKPFAVKALGLLAYYETIDLSNETEMDILQHFGMDIGSFKDLCFQLESIELVEIQFTSIVKLPEQNIRTYFFYKAFVKDRLLDFDTMLRASMTITPFRMKDSFESANLAFGEDNVFAKLGSVIETAMSEIEKTNELYGKYIETFGRFYPVKTFSYVYIFINNFKKNTATISGAALHYDFKTIGHLLQPFLNAGSIDNCSTAIALIEEIVDVIPSHLTHFKDLIVRELSITEDDLGNGCLRQKKMLSHLEKRIKNNKSFNFLLESCYRLIISAYFPANYFRKVDVWLPSQALAFLRVCFWKHLTSVLILDKEAGKKILFDYLYDLKQERSIHGILLHFDYDHVFLIIDKYLDPKKFDDDLFVNEYLSVFSKKSGASLLAERFLSSSIKVYKTLTFSNIDLRTVSLECNFDDECINEYKVNQIKGFFKMELSTEFETANECIKEICNSSYLPNDSVFTSIDLYISQLISCNAELGIAAVRHFLENESISKFYPYFITIKIFTQPHDIIDKFYSLILESSYMEKWKWLAVFFNVLSGKELITKYYQDFLTFYRTSDELGNTFFTTIDKFKVADSDIHCVVLGILSGRYEQQVGFKYRLWHNYLSDLGTGLKSCMKIAQKAYLQMTEIDRDYDFDGKTLFYLVAMDSSFLIRYVQHNSQTIKDLGIRKVHIVWDLEDYSQQMEKILDYLCQSQIFYLEHKALSFFSNLSTDNARKALLFLEYYLSLRAKSEKSVNTVLEIVRNCFSADYSYIIQIFLSLNSDLEDFKKIRFHNTYFSSSNRNDSWAEARARTLEPIIKGIQGMEDRLSYLQHIEYLEEIQSAEKRSALEDYRRSYRYNW